MCTRLSGVSRFKRSMSQPGSVVARTFLYVYVVVHGFYFVKSLDDTEAFECTFTRSICFFCLNVVIIFFLTRVDFFICNKHFFLVFYIFIMHKHFFCTWRYSALMEVYLNNSKLNDIFIILDALPYLGLKNKENLQ